MLQKVELLVHAGAPSNREDDDRYRAQAEAYLDFSGRIIEATCGLRSSHELSRPTQPTLHRLGNVSQAETNEAQYDSTTFLDDTQLAYTALNSQLFTSSLPLPDNVVASEREGENESTQVQSASRSPTNKTINALSSSPSSYLKTPLLGRPLKEPRVVDVAENGDMPLPRQVQGRASAPPPQAPVLQSQDSDGAHQSTSELPTTYSLSDITSESSRARRTQSQRSASDPGPHAGNISTTALNIAKPPDSHKGALKRTAFEAQLGEPGVGCNRVDLTLKPSLETRPPEKVDERGQLEQDKSCASGELPLNSDLLLAALSTSITPPTPEAANQVYTTHLTTALKQLATNDDLNCFRPVSMARELRPSERGHWLIEIPPDDPKWSVEKQVDFWKFLERWIGDGSVGWGVWCTREPSTGTLGTVKVYCWGEVVKHVYHLIYTASLAQARKMGVQWVDGAGDVIVQMRGA
ncbi:hypothetical protein LTR09_005620 [Extremus antarcticus]|uniref:Uncharacterized protein n=1 Tax=Extremus antarcticus TaxID=702011 RepID=A0AAJ0DMW9_9PEZI|nr:hypothetical protein LTR09_005620 [Extremus antarcticus]